MSKYVAIIDITPTNLQNFFHLEKKNIKKITLFNSNLSISCSICLILYQNPDKMYHKGTPYSTSKNAII